MSETRSSGVTVDEAFRAFLRTSGLLKRVMDPFFAQFGISGSQWGILRALHRAQAEGLPSLRVTELGQRLLIRPPSVTGAIDRLVRQGLVARTACDTDLRARQIRLTPQGRKLVDRVRGNLPERHRSLLSTFNNQERQDLHRLLEKLAAHLEPLAESSEKQETVRANRTGSSQ